MNFPEVPYSMCNTSHCHVNDEHVLKCLVDHFPIPVKPRIKIPYLSSWTIQELELSRRLRNEMWKAHRRINMTGMWLHGRDPRCNPRLPSNGAWFGALDPLVLSGV